MLEKTYASTILKSSISVNEFIRTNESLFSMNIPTYHSIVFLKFFDSHARELT